MEWGGRKMHGYDESQYFTAVRSIALKSDYPNEILGTTLINSMSWGILIIVSSSYYVYNKDNSSHISESCQQGSVGRY